MMSTATRPNRDHHCATATTDDDSDKTHLTTATIALIDQPGHCAR